VGKVDPVVWAVGVVCGGDELADEKSPEDTSDDAEAKAEEEEASVLRPGHFGLGRRSIDFLLNLGVFCVWKDEKRSLFGLSFKICKV
jgi:hypothetical protein